MNCRELRSNYAPVVAYLKDKSLKDLLVRVKIPSYFQQQDFRIVYDKGQNQKQHTVTSPITPVVVRFCE